MLKDCDSSSIAFFLFPSHVCVAYQTRHAVGVVGGALTMPGFFYVTVQVRDWLKKAHWSLAKNCGILAVVMTIGRRALERNDFQHAVSLVNGHHHHQSLDVHCRTKVPPAHFRHQLSCIFQIHSFAANGATSSFHHRLTPYPGLHTEMAFPTPCLLLTFS